LCFFFRIAIVFSTLSVFLIYICDSPADWANTHMHILVKDICGRVLNSEIS
jgi:hypothetical protein